MIRNTVGLLLCIGSICAQDKPIVTLTAEHEMVSDHRLRLIVNAAIQPPYHIYGVVPVDGPIPSEVIFDLPPGLKTEGPLQAPRGESHFDQGFETDVIWYNGTARFVQLFNVDGTSGDVTVKITVRYQACTETFCLPPKSVSIEHHIRLASAAASNSKTKKDTLLSVVRDGQKETVDN